MHNVFSKRALRAIGRGTPDTVCTSHDAIFLNARCARSRSGDGPRLYLYLYLYTCACVLAVFCVLCFVCFGPFGQSLCFVFLCFGHAGAVCVLCFRVLAPQATKFPPRHYR